MYSLNDIVDTYMPKAEAPTPPSAAAPKASFRELLDAARAGKNWHLNVRDLAASLVSRGFPDWLIHDLIDFQVTQPTYTEEKTRDYVQGLIDGWRKSKNIPKPKEKKAMLLPEQVGKLLEQADNDRDYGIYYAFPFLTGVRPSEQLGLLWEDVDLDKRTVRICRMQEKDGTISASLNDDFLSHPSLSREDVTKNRSKFHY